MTGQELNPEEERLIEKLIHTSGVRPTASPEARQRIYAAVRSEWERELTRPRGMSRPNRSWLTWLLGPGLVTAAVAALVIGVAPLFRPSPEPSAIHFGSLQKLVGDVAVVDSSGSEVPGLVDGDILYRGQELTTGRDSGAALLLATGETVRVDSNTAISLGDNRIDLERGAVYLDDDLLARSSAVAVTVVSRYGDVRHLGTQYEARVRPDGLSVSVREGAVAIETPAGDEELVGRAGERIQIATSGRVERSEIAPSDDAWRWTESLAQLPAASQYQLNDVLAWIARQTGRQLQFEDDGAATQASTLVLRGLNDLSPEEAYEVIRRTTTLTYQMTDASLFVAVNGSIR